MITLTVDRKTANVNGITLSVGMNTEYKPSGQEKISVGNILGFKYAGANEENTDSGWMRVADLDGEGKEWISLTLWSAQRGEGMFNNKIEDIISQPKKNDTGNKPQVIPEGDLW